MNRNEFSCNCSIIHEDIVENIRSEVLENEVYDTVAGFFKALGDGTRVRILWSLSKNELCVCDIANLLGMTKSAVSHQLGTLRRANLVKFRKSGKEVYYSLNDSHVENILKEGFNHVHE